MELHSKQALRGKSCFESNTEDTQKKEEPAREAYVHVACRIQTAGSGVMEHAELYGWKTRHRGIALWTFTGPGQKWLNIVTLLYAGRVGYYTIGHKYLG